MIRRALSLMVLTMLCLPDSAQATPMQRGKDFDKVHIISLSLVVSSLFFNLPVKPRLHIFKRHMMYTLYGHQIQNVIHRGTYCSEFDVFLTLSAFQRTKLIVYSVYTYFRGLNRVFQDNNLRFNVAGMCSHANQKL